MTKSANFDDFTDESVLACDASTPSPNTAYGTANNAIPIKADKYFFLIFFSYTHLTYENHIPFQN